MSSNQTNNQESAKVALCLKERCLGCFFGLIVGDAVGTTLEFTKRQPTNTLQDMEGGGPFRLEPGEWTDDASFEQPTPSYFHFFLTSFLKKVFALSLFGAFPSGQWQVLIHGSAQ